MSGSTAIVIIIHFVNHLTDVPINWCIILCALCQQIVLSIYIHCQANLVRELYSQTLLHGLWTKPLGLSLPVWSLY